jgi:hypothetical protein
MTLLGLFPLMNAFLGDPVETKHKLKAPQELGQCTSAGRPNFFTVCTEFAQLNSLHPVCTSLQFVPQVEHHGP